MTTEKEIDCVVAGSCVVDVLARPVPLEAAIGRGALVDTEPLRLTTGGIVSNAAITLARLGMRSAALTYVGNDEWAEVIRRRFAAEGVDTTAVMTNSERATSASVVLVDPSGERSFVHYAGAHRLLDKQALLDRLDLFARSRAMLIGYFPLFTRLVDDLPEVLTAIRETGCLTAMDAAGDGGTMELLAPMLPHLNFYVPSEREASHQTGLAEHLAMIEAFRAAGATGFLGIKRGAFGATVSPRPGEIFDVPAVAPPGPVIDTTGAGDCFFAALVTGILRGLSPYDATRLANAAGACCVTGVGATTAIRDFAATADLAGL
ncbi:MAG: carbohydrate kinase family protein [Pirellulales bacterium]